MLADFILRTLGENPETYSSLNKWPAITAIVIDAMVPVIILLLFLSPAIVLKLRKKKFTALNVILAIIIGAALAYGAWLLNEWSYGYGQGAVFREIYGESPF